MRGSPNRGFRHGTVWGYDCHLQAGEDPCGPCSAARVEYDHERLLQPEKVIEARERARAQSRALMRLRRAHPDEYQRYYQVERGLTLSQGRQGNAADETTLRTS